MNLLFRFSDPPSAQFAGQYPELSRKLLRNAWAIVAYAGCVVFFYVLGKFAHPVLYFAAVEIPTVIACIYVTSPNPVYRLRLPFYWVMTALLVGLVFLLREQERSSNIYLRELFALVVWGLFGYWLILGIAWTIRSGRYSRTEIESEPADIAGHLLAIWGTTLAITGAFYYGLIPVLHQWLVGSVSGEMLLRSVDVIRASSVLRFIPVALLLSGLIALTALRMRHEPFEPGTHPEFADKATFPMMLATFLTIPVWLARQIGGFVAHFCTLFVKSVIDFGAAYLARLLCVCLGILVVPFLLFAGHYATFGSVEALARTINWACLEKMDTNSGGFDV